MSYELYTNIGKKNNLLYKQYLSSKIYSPKKEILVIKIDLHLLETLQIFITFTVLRP